MLENSVLVQAASELCATLAPMLSPVLAALFPCACEQDGGTAKGPLSLLWIQGFNTENRTPQCFQMSQGSLRELWLVRSPDLSVEPLQAMTGEVPKLLSHSDSFPLRTTQPSWHSFILSQILRLRRMKQNWSNLPWIPSVFY